MSENSLEIIKKIREKTGISLGLCKKVVEDMKSKGMSVDVDSCINELRKVGTNVASKKADRVMSNGLYSLSIGKNFVATVSLACETDFVANSVGFVEALSSICNTISHSAISNTEEVYNLTMSDGRSIKDFVDYQVVLFGENISLKVLDIIQLSSSQESCFCYTHQKPSNAVDCGKSLSLVVLKSDSKDVNRIEKIGKSIAMHIFANKPIAVSESDVPNERVESERVIIKEQLSKVDKPQNVLEKMEVGKMEKFFDSIVLLRQPFVIDNSQKVATFLAKEAKEMGCELSIVDFRVYCT